MQTNIYFYQMSLSSSYNVKCLDKSSIENKNTHFMLKNVYEIMWKSIESRTGHRQNMAHAHCMLDT